MKYFLDTEFHEYKKQPTVCGVKVGKPINTIELISIGIVAEDGREYYAVSKDFNLKEAWSRFDWKQKKVNDGIPGAYKEYWIRENVLKTIWIDLFKIHGKYSERDAKYAWDELQNHKKYIYLKLLILKYGKSNKQIAEEVISFCSNKSTFKLKIDRNFYCTEDSYNEALKRQSKGLEVKLAKYGEPTEDKPEFYAYYADYDWVVFCWLFGKMIDLPKGFPMYCIDLKQELEQKRIVYGNTTPNRYWEELEKHNAYPKQVNEHNALADAKWNKELYKFIKQL